MSLNLYTYCHNNPIIFIDNGGHWPSFKQVLIEIAITTLVVAVGAAIIATGGGTAVALAAVGGGSASAVAAGAATVGAYAAATSVVASTGVLTSLVMEKASTTGEPNSTIEIKNKDGEVVTKRTYGSDGNTKVDIDYTNHGNPRQMY